MCLYPKLILNKKYTANKKNGGIAPPLHDERIKYVPVGCQNCIECRKKKAREWQIRLLEDVRHNKNGKFITLTFNDESIYKLCQEIKDLKGYELDNQIATLATRRFLERWRKTYKKSLRHWLVTELGHAGTENIHLHGILWTTESITQIAKHWAYGHIWPSEKSTQINFVNEKTVNYLTKYVNKQDEQHKKYKPIILTSPGIGRGYMTRNDSKRHKYKGEETIQHYTTRTGHEVSMPIYWRNHIFTEEEREKLWLQLLDKNERWIMGEKIDISNDCGYQQYYELLKYYRAKNKRLGYGDDEKDWNREVYENQQRELKQKQRIAKGKNKSLRRGNSKDIG